MQILYKCLKLRAVHDYLIHQRVLHQLLNHGVDEAVHVALQSAAHSAHGVDFIIAQQLNLLLVVHVGALCRYRRKVIRESNLPIVVCHVDFLLRNLEVFVVLKSHVATVLKRHNSLSCNRIYREQKHGKKR